MSEQELVKDEQAKEADETVEAVEAEPSAETTAEAAADDEVNTIFNLQPKQHLSGKVKNITQFGAFIDLGLPQDGLVHISELSRKKVEKVEDVVSVGDEVDVWVKKVDRKRGRISLTMIKPLARRLKDIEDNDELEGVVTRLESYGAFIDIDSERDGLVHISQITHGFINHPQEALTVGDKVMVKVLQVNKKKRQVDLSIKALLPPPVVEEPEPPQVVEYHHRSQPEPVQQEVVTEDSEEDSVPTAMAIAFASLQSKGADAGRGSQSYTKEQRRKQKNMQADIVARTLAAGK